MAGPVLGFVGGVIGGIFGGPVGYAIGSAIGSAIGGYIDPVKVSGPRLTDATAQTSSVGMPIPFGYGIFTTAGNLIWTDKLIEHKKTQRQGKGGGTKTTTYTYTRSYAIGICQGPIYGIKWIKRNGKKVWTSDPSAPIEDREFAQKWGKKIKLYMGGEDQMPDATITAKEGGGNVSAFRGLAYMVVTDDDLTDAAGAVAQYEFCVQATQPEAYITSKPYAQYAQEAAGVSARVGSIVLQQLREEGIVEPERAVYGFAPTGGKLDLPPHGETYEAGTYGFAPTGGKLDLPPHGETYESAQYGFAPTGGDLFSPPFGKAKKENTTYGFGPTGGALYWPDGNKVMMTEDGKVILDESGKAIKTG